MTLRGAAAAALLLATACGPSVRGRCRENTDCGHPDSYCDNRTEICIAASGTCTPACAIGQVCSTGVCTSIKPVVTVELGSAALLSPAYPQVKVNVVAAPDIVLAGLLVEVASDHVVASGTIDAAPNGDNVVSLSSFQAGAVGNVGVSATLTYGSAQTVRSVSVPAFLDNQAPTATLAINPTGWVKRSAGPITVTATSDDGSGSGLQSATLAVDGCNLTVCNATGSLSGNAFTFQMSPTAQAPGSEAPMPFTVTVQDRAGNLGTVRGVLQIDDAPPQIGAISLVSTPVTGEDGNAWFIGGSGAQDVEIAVPVSDSGSGVQSVTLSVTQADVVSGNVNPPGSPKPDGTWHFVLPASGVQAREGQLHFSVTASDALGQSPASPTPGAINVDDLPPTVMAPVVDYTTAAPASACGPADVQNVFACGRQGATHLLRDDSASTSFDAYDCGVGLSGSKL